MQNLRETKSGTAGWRVQIWLRVLWHHKVREVLPACVKTVFVSVYFNSINTKASAVL